ncbi:MAG: histidine phosphatase family protein [Lachnospiraceae bacterium]
MRILFVRHGDPDYTTDSLTEKGKREVKFLAERAKNWNVQDIYVSCLGRARETARSIEEALGKEAAVLDWLQEFRGVISSEYTTDKGLPWDFMPREWTGIPELFDRDRWYDAHMMEKTEDAPGVKEIYLETCEKLDELLAGYGYVRENGCYRVKEKKDITIVLVCHMGITFAMLSHLLGIAFPVLIHGCFLPTSSVTAMCTEEREAGYASFRCQGMGDVWHLHENKEPVSAAGYFTEPFQD